MLAALLALPSAARAAGLDGPTGDPGLYARLQPGELGAGFLADGDRLHASVAANVDYRLLGLTLQGGLRYRLVDRPAYRLDLWGETGPIYWFRRPRAFGWNADLGVRNIFGAARLRTSLGAALDLAFATRGATRFRYRPAATAGLGLRLDGGGLFPDAIWLRGSLGYDVVPGHLGAADARTWLAIRWSAPFYPDRP